MLINQPETSSQYNDIWVDQQIRPESPLYNIGGYINIEVLIDCDIYNKSINKLRNGNDALSLNSLVGDVGEPYQTVDSVIDLELPNNITLPVDSKVEEVFI